MVRPLKDKGIQELDALRRRAGRLLALDRIAEEDYRYITNRIREIEERILTMPEHYDREEAPF
jgi:hypothetical protein